MPATQSPGDIIVQVNNLTKSYGKFRAVDSISFEVRTGEVFGFLGPNGAGKTTTARILTGVLKADAGSALIFGYPAGSIRAKQSIGVVPETANPYADLSAWDNMMLMAELYGVSGHTARERATEFLRELGLLERRQTLAKGYSKGMRQRLVLGMALIGDPQILFLDEPTSGLDVQSARLLRGLLRTFNDEGKTIFITTHDMEEANQLCNRIAIISHGKIAAIDAPEKIKLATKNLHSVEVSFDRPVEAASVASLKGVNSMKEAGDKFKLYTTDPGSLASLLVHYAESNSLRIVTINTLAPSLEDAFVTLVGEGAK